MRSILLISFFALVAPRPNFSQDGRMYVDADSLQQREEQGQITRELIGNVHVVQDSLQIRSQRAHHLPESSRIEFWDNVRMREGTKWLRADRLIAYEDGKIQRAMGNVALGQGSSELTARRVTFFKDSSLAVAEDDVVMVNAENRVRLTCGRARYFIDKKYAKATESPVLVELDSLDNETMWITGKVIEMFDEGDRSVVSGDVKITGRSTEASCEQAEYFRSEQRLELRIDPKAWQADQEMKGDTIVSYFDGDKLLRSRVLGNASVKSLTDSTVSGRQLNDVSGREMTLQFHDEVLEKVVVEGTATSVYHLVENNESKGTNRVQGDRITLLLQEKVLQRIIIDSQPGVSVGKFSPPNLGATRPPANASNSLN